MNFEKDKKPQTEKEMTIGKRLIELFEFTADARAKIEAMPKHEIINLAQLRKGGDGKPGQDDNDVVDVFFRTAKYILAKRFVDLFIGNEEKNEKEMKGLVVLYKKYFANTRIEKNPQMLTHIRGSTKALSDEFYSFLNIVYDKTIASDKLLQWMIKKFTPTSTSNKKIIENETAYLGRHAQLAAEKIASDLILQTPSLFVTPKTQRKDLETSVITPEHVIALTWEVTLARCQFAPAAMGFEIPSAFFASRTVKMGDRILNANTNDVLAQMVGASGKIIGRPFSGVSTLLMVLAQTAGFITPDYAICLIDAREFYDYVIISKSICIYLRDRMFEDGKIATSDVKIVDEILESLERNKKLLVLVDNLNYLNQEKAKQLISALKLSPCVFYADTSSKGNELPIEFNKNVPVQTLELLPLDDVQQDQLLLKYWEFLERPIDAFRERLYMLYEMRWKRGETDIFGSPLGILGLAKLSDQSSAIRIQLCLLVLEEILTRIGYCESYVQVELETFLTKKNEKTVEIKALLLIGDFIHEQVLFSELGNNSLLTYEECHRLICKIRRERLSALQKSTGLDINALLNSRLFDLDKEKQDAYFFPYFSLVYLDLGFTLLVIADARRYFYETPVVPFYEARPKEGSRDPLQRSLGKIAHPYKKELLEYMVKRDMFRELALANLNYKPS
jgi:hypothetical protein